MSKRFLTYRILRLLADERGYIDPGTGSMLFTIIIGLVSAGIYALRNLIIKLRFIAGGGRAQEGEAEGLRIAMFSDDKRYWNVFEPICDELERRKQAAHYMTASPDDPALEKPYNHIVCEFIGEGNKAFAKLNTLKADIVLSSTPGLDVYQWKRSRDVKWYVHVFHAVDDAVKYRMFGLDFYDAILLIGKFYEHQIRELERIRKLPAKELVVAGLPHMDSLLQRFESFEGGSANRDDGPATVLIAPSWGPSSILNLHGGKLIDALLATNYHIIVRPHPQSFKSETKLIEGLMTAYPDSDRLEWNRDNDNFEVLQRSDIMISDFSGVIFDFALIFDKPIIYTKPEFDNGPYDAWWFDEELWIFKTLPEIGRELSLENADSIEELIDECLNDPRFQEGRNHAREQGWACRGKSAVVIVDYLLGKLEKLEKEPGVESSSEY